MIAIALGKMRRAFIAGVATDFDAVKPEEKDRWLESLPVARGFGEIYARAH